MTSKRARVAAVIVLLLLLAAVSFWVATRVPHKTVTPPPVTSTPTPTPRPTAAPAPPVPAPPLTPVVPATPPVPRKPAPPSKSAVKTHPVAKPAVPIQPAVVPVIRPPVAPPPPPPPQEWKGTDTSVTHAGQVVVRTDEQWNHFWSEHHPHEVSPDVDFTKNMVVGVFVGARPADQFSVSIVRVDTQPKEVVVEYREQPPPTGTLAINVTAYPFAIKVIPRTTLPVRFTKLNAPS